MKKTFLTVLFVCIFAIGAQAQTATPTPTAPRTSAGPVYMVTYYKIKPGKGADYTKDIYENGKPLGDEYVKQGLILGYKLFTQPTSGGPNDWDRALVVVFKNYADALDFSAERGQKFNEIMLKHYGSAEARTKHNDWARDLTDTLSSHMMRELIINPMTPTPK